MTNKRTSSLPGLALGAALGVSTVLAAPSASAASEPVIDGLFNPQTFTLDNGMQVVVVPNHRAPVISHWVWYKVGTADSPPGQSGLAHFLEHLMFKGTETLAPGEFSRTVAQNGGVDNAMTSHDWTAYFQTIARDRLEVVMRMEADRMTNLQLVDEVVVPERSVVEEERRMRVENNPGARLGEMVNAAQFLHHPYGTPVIGWMHEINAYDREKALRFYEQYYAPNNAILVVAGDITADELRPLAEEIYGSIAPRTTDEPFRVTEPPQEGERRVTLRDPRVQQPSLSRSYLAPSALQGATEHAYPLELLSEIIGGGTTSRLYRSLVIEQGLAVSAGAYYNPVMRDLSTFRFYASPRPGVDVAALEAALDAEIAGLLADGVTQDEVTRAAERMVAEAVYAQDSLSTAARTFGTALAIGQTVEEVETWPQQIMAVTVEEVNAAAQAVLASSSVVTGLLLPEQPLAAADAPATAPSAPVRSGEES